MPDKWEYPYFCAWDLAFHMLPFARLDSGFAKHQLQVFLREWYMHPNGQIPAYEFAFSDVNPPVHAWAVWRVYNISAERGSRDTNFLESCFHKLLLNFTWWVNRKDTEGNNIFSAETRIAEDRSGSRSTISLLRHSSVIIISTVIA
jgi:hypothetical protein